ncbi:hypothetical protein HPB47_014577 [Ixodes persulcatus]|uniref:Uncharacterized protein n=1 Tax=Ixodes persulcatus TaxID=34615 RepID=A0AC60QWU1_IXOPE|nr:hypothetical protein HPB47_014577 [Ixodes persulcatus]
MDQGEPSGTLRPSILDPGGTNCYYRGNHDHGGSIDGRPSNYTGPEEHPRQIERIWSCEERYRKALCKLLDLPRYRTARKRCATSRSRKVQNRRRRKRSLTSIEEPEKKAAAMSIDERPESKTTKAIVLKPFAETAGIERQEDFKIQYQTKTNTITLTTQEECTAEKLLRLKAIEKNGKQYTVCPYRAMEKNQIRSVIYSQGGNSEETPETLRADMKCDKARIIAARLIGKGTSAVLVTFEGNKLPKKVVFCQAILSVKEYRPRQIVCFSCHELGHKVDVCPRKEQRCGQCGNVHEEGMDECDREPKCRNCDAPHPANSKDCPKRRIPDKKKMTPKPPAQTKESYAAAAKSITERPKASGKDDQDELPTWIPKWAKSTQRQQPSQHASDFDAEKELNKLKNDVHIGFKMIFEAIEEIKKELALLRHGK